VKEKGYIIIDGLVYDISKFLKLHPGGSFVLEQYRGKDATKVFYELHRGDVLEKYKRLVIGKLKGFQGAKAAPIVPFSTYPYFLSGKSPYYNDSHRKLQAGVRQFMKEHILPIAAQMEDAQKHPSDELYRIAGEAGILGCRTPPGKHLPSKLPGNIKPEEFDYFHELVAMQEMFGSGYYSFIEGLGSGLAISLPAIMNYGTEEMKRDIVPLLVKGEKKSCLAISEPFAGSDVANIQCTAMRDGDYFIVNGVKKWITNGLFSDYFVTAVRTGGEGMGGISVILIERTEGVETRKMSTSYGAAAGTALVLFDNVRVPVKNILGSENKGFKIIVSNFNHERWMLAALAVAFRDVRSPSA